MSSLLSRAIVMLLAVSACVGSRGQSAVPELDVLQVLPASKRVEVGDSFQIGAQRVAGQAAENVTAQAVLRSDDETVLRVVAAEGGAGVQAVGVGAGTAHIIAELAGKLGMAEVVVEAKVGALELELGHGADWALANGTSKPLGAVLIAGDSKRAFDNGAWGSADPAVASVDMKGVVTGHTVGETVITLSRAGLTTTQRVSVQAWTLQSVKLVASFGTQLLAAGSGKLRVDGSFATGGASVVPVVQDISALFSFAVADDSELLTLDGASVLAGDAPGALTLVATGKPGSVAAGMMAQLDVEVIEPSRLKALRIDVPEQLALAMDEAELRVIGDYGEGVSLETVPTELKAEPTAAVFIDLNGGKVSPLQAAEVTLSAKLTLPGIPVADGGVVPTRDVEGLAALSIVDQPLSSVSVEAEAGAGALSVAETLQLTATAHYGALSQTVTQPALWSSADPNVAVVSNVRSGRVTAIAAGTTMLTARYRTMSASFAVSVLAPP